MKKILFASLIAFIAIGVFAFLKQASAHTLDYTVQDGDTLSSIAQSQLGDGNRWQDIFNLNTDKLSNPNIIYSGELLQMPDNAPTIVQKELLGGPNPSSIGIVTQNVVVKEVPKHRTYTYTSSYVAQPIVNNSYGYNSNRSTYQGLIDAAAAKYGVNAALMNSIIACESGYNPNAHNPSGASGIAQFMPGTYYGSWNPYKDQFPLYSPEGQIYAMALKISEGGANSWACYHGG